LDLRELLTGGAGVVLRVVDMESAVVVDMDNRTHTLTLLLNAQRPYRTIPYTDRIENIAGWQAPPETSRGNNMYNLTVRFCDLKPDLLAVPFLYLGRQVRANLSVRA
jgi:hypothetical protein